MRVDNSYIFSPGAKEFLSESAFPIGSNSFSYSSQFKLACSNVSASNSALALFDLDYVKAGAKIVFEIEARRISGVGGSVEIDSRTTKSLTTGRRIVALAQITSAEWINYRVEWIVVNGENYINFAIGGSTADVGEYEFRNPRAHVSGNDNRAGNVIFCNLVRTSNVWSVDSSTFKGIGGFRLDSASGEDITVSFRPVEGMNPVVHVTVDGGFTVASTTFATANPHTVTNSSFKIKLRNTSGANLADVTAGGNARLNIAVFF